MKRNSTIDDVARAAGVARVTVSRVLNNNENVRPQTRERVHRAVAELGYSVNFQARALASGSERQIVLVHAHHPEQEPNSFYNAGLELGALRACSSLGLDLITRAIDPEGESPSRLLSSIIERERPLGVILSPPLSDDLELLGFVVRSAIRLVAISAGHDARQLVPAVGIDERRAGRAIGDHLIALGHRRLGFVQGPAEHRAAALRYTGFVDALRAAGIDEAPWTATGDFTARSGVEAAEALIRSRLPVSALACANDDMAAGAMLALHRAGLEIPAAISVTGFDDTPMSEVVWPPLTTIRQPIKYFAERAVHLLVDRQGQGLDWHSGQGHYEVVGHDLIVRESTAAPNKLHAA